MLYEDGLVTRLIEQVAQLGVAEFLLTGGEPMARPDLAEIIGILRPNRVCWSLNTAMMPPREVRTAIEAWPPVFTAVSLDGPKPVHDAFRKFFVPFCGYPFVSTIFP